LKKQAIFQIVNTEYEWLTHIKIDPEYSQLVPELSEEEYTRLKESIASVGLYEPIIINQEGTLLDGHHRLKVVKELGWSRVNVETKHFENKIEEEIYVIETNVIRRHLDQYQKTVLAERLEPLYRLRAKQNQGTRTDLGNIVPNLEQSKEWERKSEAQAAKTVGLGKTTYQSGKHIIHNAPPEKVEEFKAGRKAGSIIKELIRKTKIAEVQNSIPNILPLDGPFDVIVMDPPWNYGTEYDSNSRRSASPYPEMGLEEIWDIDFKPKDDAVLWLWTTHGFLHEAFHLIEHWGFEYKTCLTWVKDRMGLGSWLRSQSEYCLLAVKGKPVIDLKNQTTILHAPNRGHSVKPSEFYDMVDSYCFGIKVDWFARNTREGWVSFGTLENERNE